MEKQNKHDILKLMEKGWYQSKKFLAFLLVETMLFSMALAALKWQTSLGWPLALFMFTLVICMAFITVAFNLSQSKLDSFIRVTALLGKIPNAMKQELNTSEDK